MFRRTHTPGGQHPVHIVHRVGAAILGLGLWVFAGLGFAYATAFVSTQGPTVLGMSSNGALSTLSVVAGAILLVAAAWGGRPASTLSAGMGVVFLVSGIVHLGIIHTQYNLLAFELSNVFFSFVAGVLLLILGLYGRVSGGLPPDNPYRREHPRRRDRPGPDEQLRAFEERTNREPAEAERDQQLTEAELAMGEGHATAEQAHLVEQELAQRRTEERERAYRAQRERG